MKELLNKIESYRAAALETIKNEYSRIKPKELPITDWVKGDKWYKSNSDNTKYVCLNGGNIEFFVFCFDEQGIKLDNPTMTIPAYIGDVDYMHMELGMPHCETGPAYESMTTGLLDCIFYDSGLLEPEDKKFYALNGQKVDKDLVEQ